MPEDPNSNLRGQLQTLVAALQSSGAILLPSSAEELLGSIVEAAATIFGARAASVALLRAEGTLEFVSAHGAGEAEIVGRTLPIDRGIAGFVALSGQALAISDVEEDPRFDREFAASTGYVPTSILAAPLERGDRIVGVMEVLDKVDAPTFAMHDLELMSIFSRQAAIAIEQSDLLNRLDHLLREALAGLAQADPELRLDQILEALSEPLGNGELGQLTIHIARLYSAGEREREACLGVLESLTGYMDQRQMLR